MAEILKQAVGGSKESVDSASRVVGFNLLDLAEEGRQQIESCQKLTRSMIAEAEAEAQRIKETARQQGLEEGLQQAEASLAKDIEEQSERKSREKLERLHECVEKMHQVHEEWMEEYASSLCELATSIAERVIRAQLSESKEIMINWVTEALMSTRSSSEVTLSLHPDTLEDLGDSLQRMLRNECKPETVRLTGDVSLDRHDVCISQSGGRIQAGMLAQLEQLGVLLSR